MLKPPEWGLLLTLVIAVVGWVIVHTLSSHRDNKKFRRELTVKVIEGLAQQLQSIVELACTYHANETRKQGSEVRLNSLLKDLEGQHKLLPNISIARYALFSRLLKSFKQSITRNHFEDDFEISKFAISTLIEGIESDAIPLRSYFTDLKFAQLDD